MKKLKDFLQWYKENKLEILRKCFLYSLFCYVWPLFWASLVGATYVISTRDFFVTLICIIYLACDAVDKINRESEGGE